MTVLSAGRGVLAAGLSVWLACGGGGRESDADGSPADTAGRTELPDTSGRRAPDVSPRADTAAPGLTGRTTPRRTTTIGADTTVTGRVAAVGAAPFAQVIVRGGGGRPDVGILGPLREELARLVDATVRIEGRAVPNRPPPPLRAVEVTVYEIVSINGQRPLVGVLDVGDEGAWLGAPDGTRRRLLSLPAELRSEDGAKLWIVGRDEEGGLRILSYGILRPAGR